VPVCYLQIDKWRISKCSNADCRMANMDDEPTPSRNLLSEIDIERLLELGQVQLKGVACESTSIAGDCLKLLKF